MFFCFCTFLIKIPESEQQATPASFISSTSAPSIENHRVVSVRNKATKTVKRKSKLKRQQQQQQNQIEHQSRVNDFRNSSPETSSNISISSSLNSDDSDDINNIYKNDKQVSTRKEKRTIKYSRSTVLTRSSENNVTGIEDQFQVNDLETQEELVQLATRINTGLTSNTTIYKEILQQGSSSFINLIIFINCLKLFSKSLCAFLSATRKNGSK